MSHATKRAASSSFSSRPTKREKSAAAAAPFFHTAVFGDLFSVADGREGALSFLEETDQFNFLRALDELHVTTDVPLKNLTLLTLTSQNLPLLKLCDVREVLINDRTPLWCVEVLGSWRALGLVKPFILFLARSYNPAWVDPICSLFRSAPNLQTGEPVLLDGFKLHSQQGEGENFLTAIKSRLTDAVRCVPLCLCGRFDSWDVLCKLLALISTFHPRSMDQNMEITLDLHLTLMLDVSQFHLSYLQHIKRADVLTIHRIKASTAAQDLLAMVLTYFSPHTLICSSPSLVTNLFTWKVARNLPSIQIVMAWATERCVDVPVHVKLVFMLFEKATCRVTTRMFPYPYRVTTHTRLCVVVSPYDSVDITGVLESFHCEPHTPKMCLSRSSFDEDTQAMLRSKGWGFREEGSVSDEIDNILSTHLPLWWIPSKIQSRRPFLKTLEYNCSEAKQLFMMPHESLSELLVRRAETEAALEKARVFLGGMCLM